MSGLPWFRMYTDFLNDPKIISLAFEDQRHFIGLLALKCDGALDHDCEDDLLNRIVAQRLWIDFAVIKDVKKRLIDAGLIDESWQPLAWSKRQRKSDYNTSGAERIRNYRERKKNGIDKLIKDQDGLCACCDKELEKPYNKYVVLDHDHISKENRGLVCQPCNKVIGQIENKQTCVSEKKTLALDYLEKYGSVTLHNGTVTPPDKNREDKNREDKFILPDHIPKNLWDEWMKVRTKKKGVNSDIAKKALLTKLEQCKESGFDYAFAITTAIEQSWKSVDPEWIRNLYPKKKPELKVVNGPLLPPFPGTER